MDRLRLTDRDRPAPPPVLGPAGRGGQEGRGGGGKTEGCGYRDLPPPDGRGPREEERRFTCRP